MDMFNIGFAMLTMWIGRTKQLRESCTRHGERHGELNAIRALTPGKRDTQDRYLPTVPYLTATSCWHFNYMYTMRVGTPPSLSAPPAYRAPSLYSIRLLAMKDSGISSDYFRILHVSIVTEPHRNFPMFRRSLVQIDVESSRNLF